MSELQEEEQARSINIEYITIGGDDSERTTASMLLSSGQWVSYALKLFDIELIVGTVSEVSEEDKARADLLEKMLRERIPQLLKDRKVPVAKYSHQSLQIASKNLAVDAALMILSKHVVSRLECVKEDEGLLVRSTNNFFQAARFPRRDGAYLQYDNERVDYIRSGSRGGGYDKSQVNGDISNRGFSGRMSEHHAGAKATKATSNYYRLYPTMDSPRADSRDKRGFYEDLSHLIALGFDPTSEEAMALDKDWKNGGLFIYSEADRKYVSKTFKDSSVIQKFHSFGCYHLEFGYDLAICRRLNVSKNPGYERVLGVFGGSE